MRTSYFFKKVDAAPLAAFRILMGILMAAEGFGAIMTGWVTRNYVDVPFTYHFIGFDFLHILVGPQAYALYALLGIFGLGIALGYRYRLMIIGYTIVWAAVYFGQKTSYNNHYYLLLLMCILFIVVPAHKYASLDIKQGRVEKSETLPYWTKWVFKFLLLIVYFYAAAAKLYPDWLQGNTVRIFLSSKADWPILGPLTTQDWFIMLISYGGIVFDFLVIPALWYRPTRKFAFAVSIAFHLFNSIVFQIGIFPYMMLITSVLYFEAATIRKLFFRNMISVSPEGYQLPTPKVKKAILGFLSVFLGLQLLLPLRPHYFPGSSHWTEEGHRLSWHMMLRSKSGIVYFDLRDPVTGLKELHYPERALPAKMARGMATRPDLIWQYVQILEENYALEGHEHLEVYAHSKVNLNGRPTYPLIDPEVNLAEVEWSPWKHHPWILQHPEL